MPQRINVQGVGVVEFPDGMTDAEITHAIETDILPNHAPDVAAKAKQHLAGIAAGTDIPPGAMQPANPQEPLHAWTNAAQTPTDKAGNPLPMGGAEPTSVQALGSGIRGMAHAVLTEGTPQGAAEALQGAASEIQKMRGAAARPGVGGKVEAAGHLGAALLPGGPGAALPAEQLAAGSPEQAAGTVAAAALPAAVAHVAGGVLEGAGPAAGEALSEAGVRAGQKLKPPGLSPEQAAAFDSFVREHLANGGKLGDLHAQIQAAADEAGQPAPVPDVKLPNVWRGPQKAPIQGMADANEAAAAGQDRAATLQDLADNVPAQKPLNAGRRIVGIAGRAGVDAAAHAVAGPAGPVVSELAMQAIPGAERGGAVVQAASLARDFAKSGSIRKWGANSLAAWGKALRSGDAGGLAAAASEGDQAAAGINDPAYGAVSHLGTDDLHAIYQGKPAIYVAPDGSVTPLDLRDIGAADMSKLPAGVRGDVRQGLQGVMPGRPEVIDSWFSKGASADNLADGKAFYDSFEGTRKALRSKYGDTVRMYRAEPLTGIGDAKTVTRMTTDRAMAEKFATDGRRVIAYDVPVGDVLGAPTVGDYQEFVVARRSSPNLLHPGD